jgi:7-cyano-7-deazaguanine synthase in queuosine biosynthesis
MMHVTLIRDIIITWLLAEHVLIPDEHHRKTKLHTSKTYVPYPNLVDLIRHEPPSLD